MKFFVLSSAFVLTLSLANLSPAVARAQVSLGATAKAEATDKEVAASADTSVEGEAPTADASSTASEKDALPKEDVAAEPPVASDDEAPSDATAEEDAPEKAAVKEATPAAGEDDQPAADDGVVADTSTVAVSNAAKPLPVFFGNIYTFGQRAGRVLGIRNGSLIQGSHGLHMDFRKSGLALSGNAWIDTGYRKQVNGLDTENNSDKWLQQGRFVLRATPTWTSGNWFLQAQGEIMARAQVTRDNTVDTDDAWIRWGYWDMFDVTVGRFETWEVYHRGLGLERDTLEYEGARDAKEVRYELDGMFYRENEVGQAAVHAYPFDWLRFELASAVGSQADFNHIGVRPAAIFDIDWLKIKAGAERREEWYGYESDGTDQNQQSSTDVGVGLGIQAIFFPHVELGVSGATGFRDSFTSGGSLNLADTWDVSSAGGFANVRLGVIDPLFDGLLVGLGANYSERISANCGTELRGTQSVEVCASNVARQAYVAVQHDIFERGTFKVVGAYADHDITTGPLSADLPRFNESYSVRARALVWF